VVEEVVVPHLQLQVVLVAVVLVLAVEMLLLTIQDLVEVVVHQVPINQEEVVEMELS
jgi:hypothetical protein